MMNEKQVEAALRLALETFERMGHKDSIFAGEFNGEITALREALAAVPEAHKQPRGEATLAQQDYWQEEARRYAQNAEFWRGKYEAATAQQQEPVAWMWRCKPYCGWPEWSVSLKRPADSGRDGHKRTEGYEDVPLYTSPPIEATPLASQRSVKPWVHATTWRGLTDEQIAPIIQQYHWLPTAFARAIEAKLRELNEHKEKNA